MMLRVHVAALAFVFVIGLAASAAAAPFTNGSFESASVEPGVFQTLGAGSTVITGWEVFGSNVDYVGSFWQASDGSRSIDLNGNSGPSGIRQTFDTVDGQMYRVTFDFAAHHVSEDDVFRMRAATEGGGRSFEFRPVAGSTRDDMRWREFVFFFIASSNLTTLTFSSLTPDPRFGPALDNVTVSTVPEPATLSLLGIGLVGAAYQRFNAKRKHSKA